MMSSNSTLNPPRSNPETLADVSVSKAERNNHGEPPYSHFSSKTKIMIVAITAFTGIIGSFSASVYYPSLEKVREDMGVSESEIMWTITVLWITIGIFPLVWSSLTERIGRKPVFSISMLIYTGGSVGCALSQNLTQLIICRIIQAIGASAVYGAGAGIITDIYPRERRGTALGIYYMGPLLGPSIGPVVGGYISEAGGWRWAFWFLAIWGGTICILATLVFPETHRRLVLKKHNIQQVAIPPTPNFKDNNPVYDFAIIRYPAVAMIMLSCAMLFGSHNANDTGLSMAFQDVYKLSQSTTGLCYLPVGCGIVVGSFVGGKISDLLVTRNSGSKSKESSLESPSSSVMSASDYLAKSAPELRICFTWIGFVIFMSAVLTSGWFIEREMPLAGFLIVQFFIGFGQASTFQTLSNYLIDVFPHMPARVIGVQTLWRSVGISIVVQILPTMLDNLGWGWTYTVMTAIAMGGAILVVIVSYKGEILRARFGPYDNV